MAVRGTAVGRSFDKLKAANPKMSDTEAMERAIGLSSASTAKSVKAAKIKRKGRHSPAGAAHLKRMKRGK